MRRVAIVGLGPKGLFALERLLDQGPTELDIDVYEPHPAPGAGPVYDPAQPPHLRMNYRDELIDLWPADHGVVPAGERRSYTQWHRERGIVNAIDDYSARADVGRYLGDGLRTLLAHVPAGVRVTIRPQRAARVERDGGGWAVDGERYDEVLLATGHAGGVPALPADPGARVAVRGFALTFIDVALALTEGRGGRFVPAGGRGRLRYVPGPDDVTLVPFSRSGRPMLVKPQSAPEGIDPAERLPHGAGLAGLVEALSGLVTELLADAGDVQDVAATFAAVAAGGRWPTGVGPEAELVRSLEVATGERRPDVPWAVGHAWRTLYPAIVERFSHGGLAAGEWPAFRRLAREMERMAFGPPAGNAARIVALIEAGRIDLSGLRRGPDARADTVIDAVLPPPGASGAPVEGLLAAGHVRVLDGMRGLDVDPDGSCRAADGSLSHGLAAIGRPTEDAVIGNDTLSRTLHPLAGRWAARVASAVLVA